MKFQGLSDTTIRYVRRTLCAALNDACSYGYIFTNPVDHTITRFRQSDFTPVVYDLKDLSNLMNNAYNDTWECLFLLTDLYGLRRSEALGLKWSHIDFMKREIRIDQQLSTKLVRKQNGEFVSRLKTRGSKRTFYLTSYARGILLCQMQRLKDAKEKSTDQCPFHDQDYVLFRKDGSPYEETHLARQFHLFTDQLCLLRCRIHDLRHSAASNLYYLTSDYLAVARILGHTIKGLSNTLGETRVFESTTSLYIHVHPDKQKAAIMAYHEAVELEQFRQKQKPKVIVGYNFKR